MAETEAQLKGRIIDLEKALRFCRDLAEEELVYAKVGTGAEVALRHIARRADELIRDEREAEHG